jgi:hypothetical protein
VYISISLLILLLWWWWRGNITHQRHTPCQGRREKRRELLEGRVVCNGHMHTIDVSFVFLLFWVCVLCVGVLVVRKRGKKEEGGRRGIHRRIDMYIYRYIHIHTHTHTYLNDIQGEAEFF